MVGGSGNDTYTITQGSTSVIEPGASAAWKRFICQPVKPSLIFSPKCPGRISFCNLRTRDVGHHRQLFQLVIEQDMVCGECCGWT